MILPFVLFLFSNTADGSKAGVAVAECAEQATALDEQIITDPAYIRNVRAVSIAWTALGDTMCRSYMRR